MTLVDSMALIDSMVAGLVAVAVVVVVVAAWGGGEASEGLFASIFRAAQMAL